MQGAPISQHDEKFFREMIHGPELYDYIGRNAAGYIYFFIAYMFGTTVTGSMICPDCSILIPCLHDESYARLAAVANMFCKVRGVVFLSDEERKLVRRCIVAHGATLSWEHP